MERKIDDGKVFNVWEGYNAHGELYGIVVNPDYYEENDTPVDEQGNDMVYKETYITE